MWWNKKTIRLVKEQCNEIDELNNKLRLLKEENDRLNKENKMYADALIPLLPILAKLLPNAKIYVEKGEESKKTTTDFTQYYGGGGGMGDISRVASGVGFGKLPFG